MQQERTEEPTPRRRDRARAEGQAARSALLAAALSLVAAAFWGSACVRFAQGWLAQVAHTASAAAHVGGSGQDALVRLVSDEWSPLVLRFVVTAWTVTTLAAAAAAALSGSIVPALARIAPRWRRLAPRGTG